MIDFILLVVVLVLASFIGKLDIDKRIYITLRTTVFTVVLLGMVMVLNGSGGADAIFELSNHLKEIGIGYPYSWKTKTMVFKGEIIGSYYLVLLGVITMTLIASGYEHKDMQRYRDNGKGSSIGYLVVLVIGIWLIFYVKGPGAGSGSASTKLLKLVFNSEILLLGWAAFWLAVGIYLGKYLRVIFNKSHIGK